jgi:glycosyltransferase involved in cell wall biosynthesis
MHRVPGEIPVSVIIMTKDEEENIGKCLSSVEQFGEVFVVDSGSTDSTCAIAEKWGAIVVQFHWNGKYPKKKQWCLENLPFTYDWVLYVDADEEVGAELAQEIGKIMEILPEHVGYFAGYDTYFLGKILNHGHKIYKLILLNRHRAYFPPYDDLHVEQMWEVEGHYQPNISGSTGTLKNHMKHNDTRRLFYYFARHNRYSDWEAYVRTSGDIIRSDEPQPGIRFFLKRAFRAVPLKGLVAFIHSYIIHFGFLDGGIGFHYAMARAFYYWQIEVKTIELGMVENE